MRATSSWRWCPGRCTGASWWTTSWWSVSRASLRPRVEVSTPGPIPTRPPRCGANASCRSPRTWPHADGRRARVARLVGPDPTWPDQAARLIARVRHALGDHVLRVDHIGSTSVPGLPAKDLVDVQVTVPDLAVAADAAASAPIAGLVDVGEWDAPDRTGVRFSERVLVDADPGRPATVNLRPVGDPVWREVLLFRDWLRADPSHRDAYLAEKRRLARGHRPRRRLRRRQARLDRSGARTRRGLGEHRRVGALTPPVRARRGRPRRGALERRAVAVVVDRGPADGGRRRAAATRRGGAGSARPASRHASRGRA